MSNSTYLPQDNPRTTSRLFCSWCPTDPPQKGTTLFQAAMDDLHRLNRHQLELLRDHEDGRTSEDIDAAYEANTVCSCLFSIVATPFGLSFWQQLKKSQQLQNRLHFSNGSDPRRDCSAPPRRGGKCRRRPRQVFRRDRVYCRQTECKSVFLVCCLLSWPFLRSGF